MSTCPHCHGTGRDAVKTARFKASGLLDNHSWVRCWSCQGNGNDTLADFYDNLGRGTPLIIPVSTPK